MLKLYDTLRKTLELIQPADGTTLKIYTCGPTVYNYAHIGNYRTYIFEDLLIRTLKYFGFKTYHVMNITDVDDKTIKGANENKQSLSDYTARYTQAFFDDCKTLNIAPADRYTKATEHIEQMIHMIQALLKEGIAYQASDGNVFYSIAKFPSYGKLSHLKLSELKIGASERTAGDEYDKASAADFVLWKAYDKKRDGPIFWDSPFGKGRPGWHIECSAMAIDALGPTIDLHCGGVDNIFPHHENEIAQSEGCTGKPFARHWAHAQHLIVDGKKMSKSLGNFYRLQDLIDKGYSGFEIRYLLLATHYRTQLNFTLQGLDSARQTLQRFEAFFTRLRALTGKASGKIQPLLDKTTQKFNAALADDLGISVALAALFDFMRAANTLIDSQEIGQPEAEAILKAFESYDSVLGCLPLTSELTIPPELTEALHQRNQARSDKNWAEADRLRDFITSRGYRIEDSPQGPILKKA